MLGSNPVRDTARGKDPGGASQIRRAMLSTSGQDGVSAASSPRLRAVTSAMNLRNTERPPGVLHIAVKTSAIRSMSAGPLRWPADRRSSLGMGGGDSMNWSSPAIHVLTARWKLRMGSSVFPRASLSCRRAHSAAPTLGSGSSTFSRASWVRNAGSRPLKNLLLNSL